MGTPTLEMLELQPVKGSGSVLRKPHLCAKGPTHLYQETLAQSVR